VDCEKVYNRITGNVKLFIQGNGFRKAVFGLSGGIDSSMAAYVLVDALGKENVTALLLPEEKMKLKESKECQQLILKELGIKHYEIAIDGFLEKFSSSEWTQSENALMNSKARIRMLLLYNYANSGNALVVGTSNKSELLLGYGTKYGDLGCDLLPLGDLYKTELFELAEWKGLPKKVIERKPSAELCEGQTDEEELGASYEKLDSMLKAIEEGKAEEELNKTFNKDLVERILKRIKENKHKLNTPFIIKAR